MDIISREESIGKGLKTYFTGKSCKNGHLTERLVSNKMCKSCLCEWHKRNKEQQSSYKKEKYQENKEYYLEKSRKQREIEDPEKIKAWKRKWRRSDKGKEQSRSWVAANQEKHAEYTKSWKGRNLGKVREYTRTRQAAILERTPPWLTHDHRIKIQAVYDEAVRLEREDGVPRHVDHIVPLQGEEVSGLHVPWNLAILTWSENSSKHNKFEV